MFKTILIILSLSAILNGTKFHLSETTVLVFIDMLKRLQSYNWIIGATLTGDGTDWVAPNLFRKSFRLVNLCTMIHIGTESTTEGLQARMIVSRPIRFQQSSQQANLIGLEVIVRACSPSLVLSVEKVVDTIQTVILNIPTPVRMTPCPCPLRLQL